MVDTWVGASRLEIEPMEAFLWVMQLQLAAPEDWSQIAGQRGEVAAMALAYLVSQGAASPRRCTSCRRLALSGMTLCADHRERNRAHAQRWRDKNHPGQARAYQCRSCGETGHNSRNCPHRMGVGRPVSRKPYQCGGCGGLGHNQRTCPKNKGESTAHTRPSPGTCMLCDDNGNDSSGTPCEVCGGD